MIRFFYLCELKLTSYFFSTDPIKISSGKRSLRFPTENCSISKIIGRSFQMDLSMDEWVYPVNRESVIPAVVLCRFAMDISAM